MFGIRIIKEIIVEMIADNRWILCQILFAGYMVALSAEDIRKKTSPSVSFVRDSLYHNTRFLWPGNFDDFFNGRRRGRSSFPPDQQDDKRILWIWGQYPDSSDGYVSRIWEYHISAYGSVFYGCCFFDSYAYKDSV